jgi:hypothetical protein
VGACRLGRKLMKCLSNIVFLFLTGLLAFAQISDAQIVINEIYYNPPAKTTRTEFVELYNAGSTAVDLSGWSLSGGISYIFPATAAMPAGAYWVVAQDPAAARQYFEVNAFGPFSGSLNNEGDTVRLLDNLGNVLNEVTFGVGFPWPCAAAGDGSSMELINPTLDNRVGANWRASGWPDLENQPEDGFPEVVARGSSPTPGVQNSIYSAAAPPQILQVSHTPAQPASTNSVTITAKVADPAGIAVVWLQYQIVIPGDYLCAYSALSVSQLLFAPETPTPWNPRFGAATNWVVAPMADDGASGDAVAGDGEYTVVLPPLANRTLLRYRIFAQASGQPARAAWAPMADDPSLNFACFIYDGVPGYQPTYSTVQPEGLGYAYSAETMNSLPVYFLLTQEADLTFCNGYDSAYWIPAENAAARDKFNWEGAFVYEGIVYDHVRYRLRKDNDRYNAGGGGKRCMRFRFNEGHFFAAKDNDGKAYPEKWRTLNTGNQQSNMRDGNFGLSETINSKLWNLVGVPAPLIHTFHFRVIQGADEAPTNEWGQFNGDFWGMYLAVEDYDSRFLKTHRLSDGNLYKLQNYVYDGNQVKRSQGMLAVTNDDDFQNIFRNLTPDQPDNWLREYVNYDLCYRYHAVCEAVRHYDFAPLADYLKNRAWYFEPSAEQTLGQLWTLPWDFDVTWGPCYGMDGGMDYSTAAFLQGDGKPAFKLEYRNCLREFRDLVWNEETINPMIDDLAARISEFSQADRDRWKDFAMGADFGPLSDKVQDMKQFAFSGWSGTTGPAVGPGGQAAFLDQLTAAEGEGDLIPATPVITANSESVGELDSLTFTTTPFADPQGADTFGALEWRLAEVTDPAAPAYDPAAPRLLEWNSVWTSGEITSFTATAQIPASAVTEGKAYRVRARMRDNTGRWSHWSAPIPFIARTPAQLSALRNDLRITEIMYHPSGGDACEFIELANVGAEVLDISGLVFSGGVRFNFSEGAISLLSPKQRVVVVKDQAAFLARYPQSASALAGQYDGQLSNSGEILTLESASGGGVLTVAYQDDWYPSTDGGGYSLVLNAPEAEASGLDKASWHPSLIPYGSPGTTDETQDRDADNAPDYWELAHGLNPDDRADGALDQDGDGEIAASEYYAGTDPQSRDDVFALTIKTSGANIELSFTARAADPVYSPGLQRVYVVERRDENNRWSVISTPVQGSNQLVTVTDPRSSTTASGMPMYRGKVWLQ